MEELITLLMQSRNLLHVLHLKALGGLYDTLPTHIDSLAETYQGITEELLNLNTFPEYTTTSGTSLDYVKFINRTISNIRNKEELKHSVIQNMIDTLQGDFYTTTYKLRFLK
jgi:hypothetical protein